jgi:hypothetical protein
MHQPPLDPSRGRTPGRTNRIQLVLFCIPNRTFVPSADNSGRGTYWWYAAAEARSPITPMAVSKGSTLSRSTVCARLSGTLVAIVSPASTCWLSLPACWSCLFPDVQHQKLSPHCRSHVLQNQLEPHPQFVKPAWLYSENRTSKFACWFAGYVTCTSVGSRHQGFFFLSSLHTDQHEPAGEMKMRLIYFVRKLAVHVLDCSFKSWEKTAASVEHDIRHAR